MRRWFTPLIALLVWILPLGQGLDAAWALNMAQRHLTETAASASHCGDHAPAPPDQDGSTLGLTCCHVAGAVSVAPLMAEPAQAYPVASGLVRYAPANTHPSGLVLRPALGPPRALG